MKHRLTLPFLIGVLALTTTPSLGQVAGVSYTLTPGADWIRFHDDAGFDNAWSYGGKLGFGFGQFVELSGVFDYARNAETDFSRFAQFSEAATNRFVTLRSRAVDIQRYGGDLKVNLGHGQFFPFVSVGTGILQFRPDGLQNSETVYLNGGVGIQYRVQDRYTFTIRASSLAYRYNPAASLLSVGDLTEVALSASDFEQISVANFAFGAGLQLYLGGRARGSETDLDRAFREQFSRGFRGLSLQIEPSYGQVNFSDALGFRKNQRMSGASVGIDLGPQVGLRGFYWRGMEDETSTSFDDLQAYGGELKLNFATASSALAPYLTLGGGYLDVLDGYVGATDQAPEDHPFAMGGVGVQLPIGDMIRIHGGVRALLMSTDGVDNVSDPSGVETSFMYAGGISFGIGRRAASGSRMIASERAAARQRESDMEAGLSRSDVELNSALARIDSLSAELVRQRNALAAAETARRTGATAAADSAAGGVPTTTKPAGPAAKPSVEAIAAQPAQAATPARKAADDRWVTLPIPEEGELYIRFGKPGGVSMETYGGEDAVMWLDPVTGKLIPVSAQPEQPKQAAVAGMDSAPGALTAAQVQDIVAKALADQRAGTVGEAATMDRLEKWLDQRLGAIDARIKADSVAAARKPVVVASPEVTVVQSSEAGRLQFLGFDPLVGYNLTSPTTVLLGVRGELRREGSAYRMLPEFVLGLGSETTWNLNANAAISLSPGPLKRVGLYAGAGLGFLHTFDSQVVFNLLVGTEQTFGPGTFLLEFMTQDFGNNNRFLLGYQVRF